MSKRRVTITVDEELLRVAETATRERRVPSVSAWVNQALTAYAAEETRRRSLRLALDEYEDEFGQFTSEESNALARERRLRTTVVRGRHGALKVAEDRPT